MVELPPQKADLSSRTTFAPCSSRVCAAECPARPPPTTIARMPAGTEKGVSYTPVLVDSCLAQRERFPKLNLSFRLPPSASAFSFRFYLTFSHTRIQAHVCTQALLSFLLLHTASSMASFSTSLRAKLTRYCATALALPLHLRQRRRCLICVSLYRAEYMHRGDERRNGAKGTQKMPR